MAANLDNTQADKPSGETRQFLTFAVSGEEYGVDIMTVREIKGWTEATRLPNSPDYMRGVMNLRGVIVPIFDLRIRFGKDASEVSGKNVIIILAVEDRNIGILVDAVSDILTVDSTAIKPAPEMDVKVDEYYISGLISLEERMVVLLEVSHLFDHEHINQASQVA
jgi:purine-binding chemotaxis protein CheW